MYRVLVADDERWIRKGIVKMIDRKGLGISEVYEADSVTTALEQFRLHQPDIVLSRRKTVVISVTRSLPSSRRPGL